MNSNVFTFLHTQTSKGKKKEMHGTIKLLNRTKTINDCTIDTQSYSIINMGGWGGGGTVLDFF